MPIMKMAAILTWPIEMGISPSSRRRAAFEQESAAGHAAFSLTVGNQIGADQSIIGLVGVLVAGVHLII